MKKGSFEKRIGVCIVHFFCNRIAILFNLWKCLRHAQIILLDKPLQPRVQQEKAA